MLLLDACILRAWQLEFISFSGGGCQARNLYAIIQIDVSLYLLITVHFFISW
jgi:hypothetical protein